MSASKRFSKSEKNMLNLCPRCKLNTAFNFVEGYIRECPHCEYQFDLREAQEKSFVREEMLKQMKKIDYEELEKLR